MFFQAFQERNLTVCIKFYKCSCPLIDLQYSAAHTLEPASQCCISGSHLHGNTHHPRTGPLYSANLKPVPWLSGCPFGWGDTHIPAQAKTQCSLVYLPAPQQARVTVCVGVYIRPGGGWEADVHRCVLKAPTPHLIWFMAPGGLPDNS